MPSLRLQGLQPLGLDPIDLSIDAGERVFVSGPSGSGKTLLLRAVADLDPHLGEAYLDEAACSTMPGPAWRSRVGYLPAESHWWGDQVSDHFRDGDASLLQSLGFGQEVMDWEVRRLSTGERQRLALARLLANEPEVLLLDEATANLDPPNRERVEHLVEAYQQRHRAAVLWISHDPEQRARLGGRHWRIDDGKLIKEGGA